jgi:hypothetical protein
MPSRGSSAFTAPALGVGNHLLGGPAGTVAPGGFKVVLTNWSIPGPPDAPSWWPTRTESPRARLAGSGTIGNAFDR